MSKRGAATDNNKRSKKTDDKDVYVGSTFEMVKTMSFNKFPVLVTLTAFLAFALLFVYSQGGHERVLRNLGGGWNLREVDFLAEEIPKEVVDFVKNKPDGIRIDERTTNVDGVKLFYRESHPGSVLPSSGRSVLLLHGQAFSSATWQQTSLPTIQTLSALGHRVVAVDLPGYGNSGPLPGKSEPGEFLSAAIKALFPDSRPVVVSPSMSGSFSLDVLTKRSELMCAFVPVAPVSTNKFTREEYESVSVPTLIVVGEKDTGLGRTSAKHLSQILSASLIQVFPNARHPCYLDDPDRWHRLLANFLNYVGNC